MSRRLRICPQLRTCRCAPQPVAMCHFRLFDRHCGFRLPFDVCSFPKAICLLRGNEMTRMGWTGRAPAQPACKLTFGGKAGAPCHARGEIVPREKVARAKIVARLANVLPCLIGIGAGMGTYYVP